MALLTGKTYVLPSHVSVKRQDRFGLLDSDEDEVPFWDILTAVLKPDCNSIACLIEVLDTINVTRTGQSIADYDTLKEFMRHELPADFFSKTWPIVRDLALQMPALFPDGSLPVLSREQSVLRLSRQQSACLVVHQFLCTLQPPSWQDGYQDFHIWYQGDQPHSNSVRAYLTALFHFFDQLHIHEDGAASLAASREEDWPIEYILQCDDTGLLISQGDLLPVKVIQLEHASTNPSLLGLSDGAAIISANKFVGFGRSGTQEEAHVGSSPEACPAVLVTPPLKDNEVLIINGPQAMVTIEGYGRNACLGQKLARSQPSFWARRRMLFVDALELDVVVSEGHIADLQPGNVERELRKLYIAFRELKAQSTAQHPAVYTGFWGCGAFGGNPDIKFCIQWVAASLTGCQLHFVCSNPEQRSWADEKLMSFTTELLSQSATAHDLRAVLLGLTTTDVGQHQSPFHIIQSLLQKSTAR